MRDLIDTLNEATSTPEVDRIMSLLRRGSTKPKNKGHGVVEVRISMNVAVQRLGGFGWSVVGWPSDRETVMKSPPSGPPLEVRISAGSRGVVNIYT